MLLLMLAGSAIPAIKGSIDGGLLTGRQTDVLRSRETQLMRGREGQLLRGKEGQVLR